MPARTILPRCAIAGGRVTIEGEGLPFDGERAPRVLVASVGAPVVASSTRRLRILIPSGLAAGRAAVSVPGVDAPLGELEVGGAIAAGLHLVDNPLIDREGIVYATNSGTRGQQVDVSVYRIRPGGEQEPFATGIVNATSLALDRDGDVYVSSRFEGTVYRVRRDGRLEKVASDLGVACGLAFSSDGSLFVGDRTGTIFRVSAAGRVSPFASLPSSVAAFHLAFGPDDDLYVTGPTLSSSDAVYRIDRRGAISVFAKGFGRPQGLAFDGAGRLHVVEALAGASGLYRVSSGGRRELVVAGANLVGVAFHPERGLVLGTSTTVFRLENDLADGE